MMLMAEWGWQGKWFDSSVQKDVRISSDNMKARNYFKLHQAAAIKLLLCVEPGVKVLQSQVWAPNPLPEPLDKYP